MALPMAQIPNFQLPAPSQINQQPGLAQGLASGVASGLQFSQNQQQIALAQQKMQFEKNMQTVNALLPQMTNYPALGKYYWPTLATAMNGLSPDYQLDPKTPPPPEALKPFTSQLNDVMNGINDGSISMPQAHTMTKGIINENLPKPAPMTSEQSVSAGMGAIANAPLSQQGAMMDYMTKTPQYQQMQSDMDQQRQLAQSSFNQNQESARSLMSSFETQSQDAKNAFDNFNVFNSQMQLSRQFAGAKDTTAAVNAEKASLLAFAQMAYPGTGRPGNMEMLENMEKSGPFGTLIAQGLNKLDKGEIMTDSQIKGLRQSALGIAQSREQSQTDQENTTAQAMKLHGADPKSLLRNYRPSGLASTSSLFPNPNPQAAGTVRKLTINGKQGTYKLLGGNAGDPENWTPVDSNE